MKTIPKNILHTDNLGKEIIRKMNQYVEPPKTGFLAGGAVANTILSMEWGGDYPINDLDIFRIESTNGLKSTGMPHRFMDMNLHIFSYRGKIDLWADHNHKNAYTVSKVARNGLLNIVDVQLAENNQDAENYKNILKGFDLNCCQVGIDLENEKVIYSAAFGFFLETAQLQVDHPCTPFHTAIRIAKKKKELHCYCDEGAEFKYLSQVPLLLGSRKRSSEIRNIDYAKYFGKDNYNLYLQYHEELDKYFEVKKISNGKAVVELFTMIPRDPTVIEEFKYCYNLDTIKAMRKLLQGKKTTRNKNIRILKRDDLSKDFLFANPNYAQCDWDEKHIQQIREFLNHHAYMAIVFDHFKLNIQEQLTAMRMIKRMAEKEGLYVIGLIEDAIWKYQELGDTSKLPPDNVITEEWIKSLIDGYLERNSGLLKEPEDLTEFECRNYFSELITTEELMSEGAKMHHCVGGYAESIKKGESMIFHIEAGGEPSTIEIAKHTMHGTVDRLSISQHKGTWNKEPSRFHKRRARDLVNYLNLKHW